MNRTVVFGLVAFVGLVGCAPFSGASGAPAPVAALPSPPREATQLELRTFSVEGSHAGFFVAEGAPSMPLFHPTSALASAELGLERAPSGLVDASAARCPEEMALVAGRVCVDRWEAALVDHEGKALSPYEPVDHLDGYRAISKGGIIPQAYISGAQAETACHAAGKRLCTTVEWERGCRGPGNLHYPYGNDRRAHVCNDDVRPVHPVVEAASKLHIPKEQLWTKGMNLSIINQLPGTLLPTGDRSECVTPEGLFDMVGNLHEWIAETKGTFRGGYYMDTSQNGEGCSYKTSAHAFGYHDYSTGFRCCADPDSIE